MISTLSFLVIAALAVVGVVCLFISNQKDERGWGQLYAAIDQCLMRLSSSAHAQMNTSQELTRWKNLEGGDLKRVVELPDAAMFSCELITLEDFTYKVNCTWSIARDDELFRLKFDLEILQLGLRGASFEIPLAQAAPYLEAIGISWWVECATGLVFSSKQILLMFEASNLSNTEDIIAYIERFWAQGHKHLLTISTFDLERCSPELLRLTCQFNEGALDRALQFSDALVESYPSLAEERLRLLQCGLEREHVPSMIAWLRITGEPLPKAPQGQALTLFWANLDRYGELEALIEAHHLYFIERFEFDPQWRRLNAISLYVFARCAPGERFELFMSQNLKYISLELYAEILSLKIVSKPELYWARVVSTIPPRFARRNKVPTMSAEDFYRLWDDLLSLCNQCWLLCDVEARAMMLSWLEQVALYAAGGDSPKVQELTKLMDTIFYMLQRFGQTTTIRVLDLLSRKGSSEVRQSARVALKRLMSTLDVAAGSPKGALTMSEQDGVGGLSLSDDPQGKLSVIPE